MAWSPEQMVMADEKKDKQRRGGKEGTRFAWRQGQGVRAAEAKVGVC